MTDTDVSGREPTREEIIAFLNGEGMLEDCWFGEKHPIHSGYFWWRKYLGRLRSPGGDGELVAALRHALKLLEPFDDPELSLGLGSNALAPIRAAIAAAEAECAKDRCKCGAMSEQDCDDLPSLRHCGGAEVTSAPTPAPVSGERERPVRVTRNWSDAKLGNCDVCGQRARIVDDGEGVMICAPCSDAGYLSDWQDYARNLEEKITALQSQDREDAERYRCLSSMATQQADYLGPIFRIDVRRTPQTLFNFDAAVDHARRAMFPTDINGDSVPAPTPAHVSVSVEREELAKAVEKIADDLDNLSFEFDEDSSQLDAITEAADHLYNYATALRTPHVVPGEAIPQPHIITLRNHADKLAEQYGKNAGIVVALHAILSHMTASKEDGKNE